MEELMAIGPGVLCARATQSAISSSLSHCSFLTNVVCITLRIAYPELAVRLMRNVVLNSTHFLLNLFIKLYSLLSCISFTRISRWRWT